MYIQSTEGLALQGSGSSESNYGVRQICDTLSFTYAQGRVNIMNITASASAPTNFAVSFYWTFHADNITSGGNVSGPLFYHYYRSYALNSSGFFVLLSESFLIAQGNAYVDVSFNTDTQRVIRLQAIGTSATYTSIIAMYHVSISCSDFSLLTFS